MYKLDLEMVEEPEIKFLTSIESQEKKEKKREREGIPEKIIYFCFIDYTKAFDCVDHNKPENSSGDGNTRLPYLSPYKYACN